MTDHKLQPEGRELRNGQLPHWAARLLACILTTFALGCALCVVMAFLRGRAFELKYGFIPLSLYFALWSALFLSYAVKTWPRSHG